MTVLGDLRRWVQNSNPGDKYEIGDNEVQKLNGVDETTSNEFNEYFQSLNPKFIRAELSSDARTYVFTRIEDGDKLFNGDSDERLQPDTTVTRFRPRYRKLNDAELQLMDEIKSKASELESLYERIEGKGRGVSIALTKLEESVMWAVKDLTK